MDQIDVNGSWWAGLCSKCGMTHMFRSRFEVPELNREWCHQCCKYAMRWRWIRVRNADVTDGNVPIDEDN